MKIQLFKMRHMVLVSTGAVALLGWTGVHESAKADDAGPVGSFVMYAILAIAAVFVVQRCLLLPSKVWVRFDDGSLSWRTHKSLIAQEVSPSGTVALDDVVSAAVIVQHPTSRVLWNRRQVEMRSVRLELRDGEHVVLPIRGRRHAPGPGHRRQRERRFPAPAARRRTAAPAPRACVRARRADHVSRPQDSPDGYGSRDRDLTGAAQRCVSTGRLTEEASDVRWARRALCARATAHGRGAPTAGDHARRGR
ncbi:hypothetical protein GCM10010289_30820 [Streptomyces violascens]|uniref:Uncharacterized protein n=1 Tax=Streptomyces violascens TaxID=67381 RepID=A0ABQ3R0C2_9ACTN|nr:hypothetical protein GCM10010289_30820 [Streptomyces violascens]GHI42981.1 hypothetical protein Sviol_73890 [Streptomyces violascens]